MFGLYKWFLSKLGNTIFYGYLISNLVILLKKNMFEFFSKIIKISGIHKQIKSCVELVVRLI